MKDSIMKRNRLFKELFGDSSKGMIRRLHDNTLSHLLEDTRRFQKEFLVDLMEASIESNMGVLDWLVKTKRLKRFTQINGKVVEIELNQ